MPLSTDLSVSPYNDDHDPEKNFSKILFKPGPAVQVRELNQLQTLLQVQIERFGDNVFKRGTIVDGCQFSFHPDYDYIKLVDADSTGEAINVSNFKGLFVTDENTGVTGRIIETADGYEATAPDLNTVYITYTRSGYEGELTFTPDAQLLVTDLDRTINSVEVLNNVAGFSNNDVVVFMPAVRVNAADGGTAFSNGALISDVYAPGQVLTQSLASSTARAVIVSVTDDSESVILKLRPLANSLVGASYANGLFFSQNTFEANTTVPVIANTVEAYISEVIGAGAVATVTTTTSGRIENGLGAIQVQAGGIGYETAPYVAVASGTANSTQVASLQIQARNFFSRVTVANTAMNSVGTGYAFGVSEGVIYQKGYFSRVDPQVILVEKYSTDTDGYPDGKAIGFDTNETIVNSNTDFSLLDISNTRNAIAPGADRLALYPVLVVKETSDISEDSEFFSIVEFAKGVPFKQIQETQYNAVETNMANRTYEAQGNFVMDQFLVTPVSEANALLDSTSFQIAVDPGAGYISGRRVETINNYVVSVDKAIDTELTRNINVDINIGNYIDVEQLAGMFPTSKLVQVDLYDTAKTYYASSVGTAPSSAGTKIGTARIRAVTAIDGVQGTPNAKYRVYLFGVSMMTGKSFSKVKSIFYNGASFKAVADVIGTAKLRETGNNSLVFPTKFSAVKTLSSANVTFTVRETLANTTANGLSTTATVSIAAGLNGTWPYAGMLTDNELRDIIVSPTANVAANTSLGGTITGVAAANVIVGNGTTFVDDLYSGAFFQVGAVAYRVTAITNNTHLSLASNITPAFTANTYQRFLPKDVPISLSELPGATATVAADTLQIGLGFVTNPSTFGVNVSYNKNKNQSSSAAAKTTKRKAYVRLNLSTHTQSNVGPWCLGLPDIFRLRNVWRRDGANAAVSDENVTSAFYIDNNQNENYLDLGYLMKRPGSKFSFGTTDRLLVEFDVFQNPADRPFTIDSYGIDDTKELAEANNSVHTAEIPQFYGIGAQYYDLRDTIDFRPTVIATANILATTATATTNPAEATSVDQILDKTVPAPQSDLRFNIETYQRRSDRIVMTANGDIRVLRGSPTSLKGSSPPQAPSESITLDVLNIAPYPSVPVSLSDSVQALYDTYVGSERLLTARQDNYGIKSSTAYNIEQAQVRRWSMADIGSLDRRLTNVEEAVTLSLVEQEISDLVIPSSLETDTVRFKFGFAIDNFNGLQLSDTTNPQFNATIFNGVLTPRKKQLRISYVEETGEKVITLPRAADYLLISQTVATDGAVVLPQPPKPPIPQPTPLPKPPVVPPVMPKPPVTLETDGKIAHVCGLVPGTVVDITVRDPTNSKVYMKVSRTADSKGCVEAPVITTPPPPVKPPVDTKVVDPKPKPTPVVVTVPVVTPVVVTKPTPVITVTPTPKPVANVVPVAPKPLVSTRLADKFGPGGIADPNRWSTENFYIDLSKSYRYDTPIY